MQASYSLWIALAVFLFAACQSAGKTAPITEQRQLSVTWSFDLRHDRETNPHCNVFLRVNGRRILILRNAGSEFQVVTRPDYRDHKVPAEAVAACTGWWAGQGEDLYVIRHAGRLIIFRRDTDESAPLPVYTRLKLILLSAG